MGESVDIVVSESGTDETAKKINDLGQAADEAAKKVDSANSSLTFLKEASSTAATPLEQITAAVNSATAATTSMNNAVTASESLLRQQQSAADRIGISLEEYQQRTENFRASTEALGQAVNQSNQAINQQGEAANQNSISLGQSSQAVHQGAEEAKKHSEATEQAAHNTEHFTEATHLLKEALVLIGVSLGTEKLIEYSNAYEKVSDQLFSVSASMKDVHHWEEELLEISQRTGSSFTANVGVFQKMSVQAKALGIDQEDLLKTIEGVNNAVRLSGGEASDAAQALNVFQRAIATGQVQGRQFRQLLIQFPGLAKSVAKGLNEPIGALMEFSTKAPLAAKDFIQAFNETSEAANKVGTSIRMDIESAIVILGNSITAYVGKLNESSQATNMLADVALFLANNLTTIATIVRVVSTAWLSYYAILVAFPAAIGLITGAVTALTTAIAANPLGFLIVGITTAIALVYQFGDSIRLTADGSISLMGALIGTWDLLRNAIMAVYNVVAVVLGPAFQAIGFIIEGVFILAKLAVQGFINVLGTLLGLTEQTKKVFMDLAFPFIAFKDALVGSMTEATKRMDEAGEHTKTLSELLGGDDARSNLSGSSDKATKSVNTLAGSVENLTQMGRVNASLIPVFTGAYDEMVLAHKRASDAAKAYAEDVKAEQDALNELALVSRNAFGEMTKASDEWALRSGANFNSVKNGAQSTSDAISGTASSTSALRGSSSSRDDFGGGGGFSYGGQGNGFSSGMYVNPALEYAGMSNMGMRQAPDWLVEWFGGAISNAAQNKEAIKKYQAASGAPGFAQGGSFNVGGSGGTDSELVQFYATPGERVTIETPSQRARSEESYGNGKTIVVNMKVVTPDADSFRRSQTQNLLTLKSKLGQV